MTIPRDRADSCGRQALSVAATPSPSSATRPASQDRFWSLLVAAVDDRSFLKPGEKRSQKLFRPRCRGTLSGSSGPQPSLRPSQPWSVAVQWLSLSRTSVSHAVVGRTLVGGVFRRRRHSFSSPSISVPFGLIPWGYFPLLIF